MCTLSLCALLSTCKTGVHDLPVPQNVVCTCTCMFFFFLSLLIREASYFPILKCLCIRAVRFTLSVCFSACVSVRKREGEREDGRKECELERKRLIVVMEGQRGSWELC